jgi:cytochrome c nitrite reductase small subunit
MISVGSAVAASIGILCGVAIFTFGYARAGSYLTDKPEACANCHIMQEQYTGWMKSSHRRAAVCNDCHTPAGFIPKYFTKALNGVFHSTAFTTGHFEDHIQIKARSREITEEACMKCHTQIAHAIDNGCIKCHSEVGH